MARQRALKPEFFRDKKIARLGAQAALVYQALWIMADDGGVANADPEIVKGEMFQRWSDMTTGVLTECLQRLSDARRIRLYAVGDDLFAEVPTLLKHQTINHPSKFRYPRGGQPVGDVRAYVGGQLTFGGPPVVLQEPSLSETNTETETETNAAAAAEGLGLTPDGTAALTRLLRGSQNPTALLAEVRMILAGGRGLSPAPTPEDVSLALQDLALAGGAVTGAKLRGFVQAAARNRLAPKSAGASATPFRDAMLGGT